MKLTKEILIEMIEEEISECGMMPPPMPMVQGQHEDVPPEGDDRADDAMAIADLVADIVYILRKIIREEIIKEFTTTGIDVPRVVSLRRPLKRRSKAKDPIKRIETDLHYTQDSVDRLEEFTREIYNMLIKIVRKNK